MQAKGRGRQALAENLRVARRAMARDFLLRAIAALGDADLTLPQLGAMMLLDDGTPRTVTEVSEMLGRSPSATSRLLDQLVQRKLVKRIEDPEDRRARRVSLSERGIRLVQELHAGRADAQLELMEHLDEAERAQVFEAFALLAEATRRRRASDGG